MFFVQFRYRRLDRWQHVPGYRRPLGHRVHISGCTPARVLVYMLAAENGHISLPVTYENEQTSRSTGTPALSCLPCDTVDTRSLVPLFNGLNHLPGIETPLFSGVRRGEEVSGGHRLVGEFIFAGRFVKTQSVEPRSQSS
jgi:hypothetical protein